MDNLEPTGTIQDPVDPVDPARTPSPEPTSTPATPQQSWKDGLRSDLRDSPLVKKFGDDVDGFNKFAESYGNLEKLLGHEKVPVPKGDDDVEGWNRFKKAMGIPEKADQYALPDPQLPESMKGITIDKNKFAEVVHAYKLTPSQAEGLWKMYNEININSYTQAVESHQRQVNDMIAQLRGQWGDAYDTNVELGQMVINKFSDDQDMNDFITAALSGDARGVKFLAKLGEQFAENKIGEFQMKRFSLAPEQAQEEIDKIMRDPNHPYNNDKATPREHQAAIDYVNSLYASINRAKG